MSKSTADPLLAFSMTDAMTTGAWITQLNTSELLLNPEFGPPSPPWEEEDYLWSSSHSSNNNLAKREPEDPAKQPISDLLDLMLFRPLSPSLSSLLDKDDEDMDLDLEEEEEVDDEKEVKSHNNHLAAALSQPASPKHFFSPPSNKITSSKFRRHCEEEEEEEKSANQPESLEVTIYGPHEKNEKEAINCHSTAHTSIKLHLSSTDNNNSKMSNRAEVGHCSICKLVFADAARLKEHKDVSTKRLTCCQCSKSFVSVAKLVSHQRKHSKEKPYQCKSCGKFYTHRATLIRHQQHYCQTLRAKCEDSMLDFTTSILETQDDIGLNTKLGLSDVKLDDSFPATLTPSNKVASTCKICCKVFDSHSALHNHSQEFLGQRQCCLCLKILGNKSKLLTHYRSHTKESPFSCHFCGKSFSETSTLRKHEATHGAKNFQCQICDRGFVRKDYLAKHVLTHRQTYKCSQCDFVCHDSKDIELHVSVH